MNKKRLLTTFINLIKIDSPTGKEEEISIFASQLLKKAGFVVSKDEFYNIIAHNNKNIYPILLNAHLDTVEPCKGVVPVIKNGLITSKGETILGADNKAAIAAIIEAVTTVNTTRRVEIVFTTQEESANVGAINLDYSKVKSSKGFCFDCGEPLGSIIIKSPYYSSFEIEILGKAAHAAFSEKGVSSITAAAAVIKSIKTGKISPSTTVNIGTINGGSSVNTVPDKTVIRGEVRSYLEEEMCRVEKELLSLQMTKSKTSIKVNILRENDGYFHDKNGQDMNNILKILNRKNLKAIFKESWACSDANIFNQKDMRVYNLGEGARDIHSNKESIDVNDICALTELIIDIIGDFK